MFIGRTDAEAETPIFRRNFGHLVRRADSLEKIVMLEKTERLKTGGEGYDRG